VIPSKYYRDKQKIYEGEGDGCAFEKTECPPEGRSAFANM